MRTAGSALGPGAISKINRRTRNWTSSGDAVAGGSHGQRCRTANWKNAERTGRRLNWSNGDRLRYRLTRRAGVVDRCQRRVKRSRRCIGVASIEEAVAVAVQLSGRGTVSPINRGGVYATVRIRAASDDTHC